MTASIIPRMAVIATSRGSYQGGHGPGDFFWIDHPDKSFSKKWMRKATTAEIDANRGEATEPEPGSTTEAPTEQQEE